MENDLLFCVCEVVFKYYRLCNRLFDCCHSRSSCKIYKYLEVCNNKFVCFNQSLHPNKVNFFLKFLASFITSFISIISKSIATCLVMLVIEKLKYSKFKVQNRDISSLHNICKNDFVY